MLFLAQNCYDYFTLAKERRRPQLVTISYSHYNEYARWCLELSKIPFDEHGFAPGQHILTSISVRVAKNGSRNFSNSSSMSGGKASPTSLPVLVLENGTVLKDSWEIAEHCSGLSPIPNDLRELLDMKVGTSSRKYIYSVLLKPLHSSTFTNMCIENRHWGWRILWHCGFGYFFKVMLTNGLKLNDKAVIKACIDDIHDLLNTKLAAYITQKKTKYICGDTIGQADIAIASLCAVLVAPDEYGGRTGTMGPYINKMLAIDPEFKEFVTKARETVVGKYTLQLYKDYRIPHT